MSNLITLCLYLQIQSPKEPGVETDSSNWPSYYHGDLDDDDTYFDEEKIVVPEGREEQWFSWRMLWAFTGMDCQVRGDCQKHRPMSMGSSFTTPTMLRKWHDAYLKPPNIVL